MSGVLDEFGDAFPEALNVTSEAIDFEGIDEDLASFQEDEMVKQALQRGVDLRKYADELEKELRDVELESVQQYVDNSPKIHELHQQIQDCDAVLARMQDMLQGFQSDLGSISDEIKYLQDQSLTMNVKLRNRRAAEERLHKFVEYVAVTSDAQESVMAPEMNEAFLEFVQGLNSKIAYLQLHHPASDGSSLDIPPCETKVGQTLLPELEKLKIKAIAKCRDYFMFHFNALRKPKTNVQMIQQNALLRYRYLMRFLQESNVEVAEELKHTYIESMGKTLSNLFKSYFNQLLKLELQIATRNDLIAVEEAAMRSMFSNKLSVNKKVDPFSLAERDVILDQVDSEPILVHVANAEGAKLPYEVILRSVIRHLVDAASSEYLFILDFFKDDVAEIFKRIFARTLSLILENVENYLLGCYDAIGLLLMIKLIHAFQLIMQRRRIPVLDSFFDRIFLMLWPRLKNVFDANLRSVQNANPQKLGTIDLHPHYVTRRYAEFVAAVLTLHGGLESLGVGGGGEEMLLHDLAVLRGEVVRLLERLGDQLGNPKSKIVFITNNVDQILTVLHERRIMSDEVAKFEDLLMRQREAFVEAELRDTFSRLVSFVQQTEQAFVDSNNNVSLDEGLVEALVRDFASNWRQGIQQINDDALAYFSNFRNGMEILKQVLTQLLLYYTRLQEIVKRCWPRPPAFTREFVTTATILAEIKRYSRTF